MSFFCKITEEKFFFFKLWEERIMKLAERWQKIVEQNGVENHEILRVLSTQIFFFLETVDL